MDSDERGLIDPDGHHESLAALVFLSFHLTPIVVFDSFSIL
jgi:hypothetical protein